MASSSHPIVGYSGTPLARKLGIIPDCRLKVVGGPGQFCDWLNFEESQPKLVELNEVADVIVFFVTKRELLANELSHLIDLLAPRGGLWIAWPKKASKAPTDITEDTLRDLILPTGLVDNKVCAISEIWSGLRFVRRKLN